MKVGKLEPGQAGRTRGVGVGGETKSSVKPPLELHMNRRKEKHINHTSGAYLHTSQQSTSGSSSPSAAVVLGSVHQPSPQGLLL